MRDDLWIYGLEWLLVMAELKWTGYLYYKDGNC
jgi:hypothetical protein